MTQRMYMAALAMVLVAGLMPGVARAQELRGTVMQPDGTTPASGVVALFIAAEGDSAGTIVARVTTGDRGLFTLRAPAGLSVTLRLLRLGQRPINRGPFTLAAGETRELNVTLANEPITIASVNVRASTECTVRPEGASVVAQLYEEARKALLSSASSVSGAKTIAQYTQFGRDQDRGGAIVSPVKRKSVTLPTSKPFVSRSAVLLDRLGYVVQDNAGVTYYAPDADVLLSDRFLSNHCLQLEQGTGERAAWVGVGFRPVAKRPNITDIRGTLWLDRATTMLQTVEFTYDPIPSDQQRAGVGGRVDFTRLPNGLWFVNSWNIRMPRLVVRQQSNLGNALALTSARRDTTVDGLQITGGEVESVRIGDDLAYRATLSSMAAADMSPATPKNAPPPLTCVGKPRTQYVGVASGRVLAPDSSGAAGATVIVQWQESFRVSASNDFRFTQRTLETETQADGRYVLCGVPSRDVLTFFAMKDEFKSKPLSVRPSDHHSPIMVDLKVTP